jgi:hypothetical protein
MGCKGKRNTDRFKNSSARGDRNDRREYTQRWQIFHDLTDGQTLKIYTKKRMSRTDDWTDRCLADLRVRSFGRWGKRS